MTDDSTPSERCAATLAKVFAEHALFSAFLLQLVPSAASPKEAMAALVDWRELETATWDLCTEAAVLHVRTLERRPERETVRPKSRVA
jgi:hypothetical protein